MYAYSGNTIPAGIRGVFFICLFMRLGKGEKLWHS